MTKNIYILFFLVLFISCNDEELIPSQTINDVNLKQTRAAGDGKYDALGYGYNCFYADFSDPLYVQAKVIDIERLKQGKGRNQITGAEVTFNPTEVNEAILHGRTESRVAYGNSIEKLTKNLHINVKTNLGTKILKLFSLDLEATIDQNNTDNSLNSFYKVDALKTTRRLTLPYTSPSRLKYFLSDELLADLKFLSGKELIDKYGSHVMTDILLGGKFSAFYTGKYESLDQHSEQEFKAESNFLLSSVKAGVKYDQTLFKSFKRVNIYIKTQGGTINSNAIISQNSDGVLDNASIDYAGWMNSVDLQSESLIGVGNPDIEMHLLSDFIDNPITKKEIEGALVNSKPTFILASTNNHFKPKDIGLLTDMGNHRFGLITLHNSTQGFARAAVYFIKEGRFYKIKNYDLYLDSSGMLVPPENTEKQLWDIEVSPSNPNLIKLKNVKTGLYISSYDGSFCTSTIENEDQLYWNVSSAY